MDAFGSKMTIVTAGGNLRARSPGPIFPRRDRAHTFVRRPCPHNLSGKWVLGQFVDLNHRGLGAHGGNHCNQTFVTLCVLSVVHCFFCSLVKLAHYPKMMLGKIMSNQAAADVCSSI